ncbi:type IV pilus modification protein PilV [Ectothiorhodospira mobilis]|uniref:type IV pilus modification protein PilV n=1 Tax=Ectothiorhodospira mobilis TaxID=195064 RepID=UPI001903FEF2|nr:type IV pilus modification protein PilV [Ectothiorhodospira mobilis]MBK1692763.1 type IV pilus modification protein PilV [Ectothiorhodospira mobilis]
MTEPNWKRNSGVSLVEVLVALVVLSIGILGVAALHGTALKNNTSSYVRSQMMLTAYDLADRMRANREAALNGEYDGINGAQHGNCETATGCTPQQMAEHDIWTWKIRLGAIIPNATGTVCRDSSPDDGTSLGAAACSGSGDLRAIKIWWQDDEDGNTTRLVIGVRL